MGSSFTIEDPFQRQQYDGMKTSQKAKVIFADMGKGMWRQGKGFGMVGALYAGTECVIEGVSLLCPPPSQVEPPSGGAIPPSPAFATTT